MDIFNTYATDPAKEIEGAQAVIGEKGEWIKVARLGNRNYARMLAELIEANRAILEDKSSAQAKKLADEKSDEIMVEVCAQTLLLGWGGGMTYRGQDYSLDAARAALAHADFRRKVMEEAGKFEHFKAKAEEEQGNA